MTKILLGEGVLTWVGSERRSDRYGFVYLMQEGNNSLSTTKAISQIDPKAIKPADMFKHGELVAVVTQNRDSTHIGDLARGVFPSTPEIGEVIVLGSGQLTMVHLEFSEGVAVGLLPDDDRRTDWLDINALYRAHEQSVKLYFQPGK